MLDKFSGRVPDHKERLVKPGLDITRAPKRGTIYISALALAMAAVLGAASIESLPARAVGETQSAMPQKIPSFAPLVKQVAAAVVSIRVKSDDGGKVALNDEDQSPGQNQNPFEGTPFERFFQGPNSPFKHFNSPRGGNGLHHFVRAQGSGFFISSDGYVVTNNHVASNAVSLEVVTENGKTYSARVIGTDPRTDLALLKVDGKNDFPYVKLAQGNIEVGDWVVAMGNPFGLGGTVTAGGGFGRRRGAGGGAPLNFLPPGAPVNKGNSGGPTFNQDGEV